MISVSSKHWRAVTFLTIDQKDEETWHDQQEDKDKDNDIVSD